MRLLEENHFDLIFLDLHKPGVDGLDVCKRLHATAANPNTPVVFVTALADFETRVRSAISEGIDFVGKPVLLIELAVKALTHLLRARAQFAT
jgi:DNA-binding response OmpR family regulator